MIKKTVKQALIDQVHYPVPEGFVDNVIIARGFGDKDVFDEDVANDSQWKGAIADCLFSLIEAPNFNEADKSFSLSDKELILKKANALYKSIGEDEKLLNHPRVYVVKR